AEDGEQCRGLGQVAGQGGGGQAGVVEEDPGAVDVRGGVGAVVVAELPGGQGPVEVAGDLAEQLPEPGRGQGQGADDVVGDGGLVQAGVAPGGPVQAADRLGCGAGQGDGVVAGQVVVVDHLAEVIHGCLLRCRAGCDPRRGRGR